MNETAGILIVEDRGIVAAKVKSDLERASFAINGMAATPSAAIEVAERMPLIRWPMRCTAAMSRSYS